MRKPRRVFKREKKLARDMLGQIDSLTARWHLGFSEDELNVLRLALSRIRDGE